MDRTATSTYLERLIFAAGVATLAVALWPRASEPAELGPASIEMHEAVRVAPPPPIVAQIDVPAAPPTRDISLVFTAGGSSWIELAELDVLPKHGKPKLADDDYVTSAIAPIAEANIPAAQRDWLGTRVVVDGTCTARVTQLAVVSRLTGYPSYAGVENATDDKWTAAAALEHGARFLAAKLDNCAGGTFARRASLAPVVIPPVIDDAPLAAAALAALSASPEVKAGATEWAEYQQAGNWVDDEYTARDVRVVRHPTTGVTWVSAHLYYGGGCGAPNLSVWGLYRVDDDGTLVRAKTSLGQLTQIDQLVDLDNDGELEVIGRPWLGTERAVQAADGSTLATLSLPLYACPC
jgi:hypothetical protein